MGTEPQLYYSGSISNAPGDVRSEAAIIIEKLRPYGHVLDDHLARSDVIEFDNQNIERGVNIFDRDMAWVGEADYFVANVSVGSWGGGREFHHYTSVLWRPALVICHATKRLTKMIADDKNPFIEKQLYRDLDELDGIFHDYFKRHPFTGRAPDFMDCHNRWMQEWHAAQKMIGGKR